MAKAYSSTSQARMHRLAWQSAGLVAIAALGSSLHLPAAAQDASLFQDVLRRSWSGGSNGQPKEVTFQSFFVGQPFAYRPGSMPYGSPDGPGGRIGTKVYPVRTTFTVRETYSTELQYAQRTRDFSCFLTAQNYWTCNMTGGGFETKNWSVRR